MESSKMKKKFWLYVLNVCVFFGFAQTAIADQSYITRLKNMFEKVTIKKNARDINKGY